MHLDRIDILRALAILLVFVYHSQIVLFPGFKIAAFDQDGMLALQSISDALLNLSPVAFGWTGVQLFLIISGFLIHLGHLRGLEKGRSFSGRTFFSKRFWRIYPPYLVALLVFCFAINGGKYFSHPEKLFDLVIHLLVMHNLTDSTYFTINPSFWSIALEVQLYLIYPLFLFIRARLGVGRTVGMTLVLSTVMLAAGSLVPPGTRLLVWKTSVFAYWYIWCAGAFLAERFHAGRRIIPSGNTALALSFLLFVAMTASICFRFTTSLTVPFAVGAWLLFFEWLLHVPISDRVMRSFPSRALIVIGLCSYSIYLIHQPYLRSMMRFFGSYSFTPAAMLVKLSVSFAVIFLVSYAMYLLVEQPSIAFGAQLRAKGGTKK